MDIPLLVSEKELASWDLRTAARLHPSFIRNWVEETENSELKYRLEIEIKKYEKYEGWIGIERLKEKSSKSKN